MKTSQYPDLRGQFKYVRDNSYSYNIAGDNKRPDLAGTSWSPNKGLVLVMDKPQLMWVQTANLKPRQEEMVLVVNDNKYYYVLACALGDTPANFYRAAFDEQLYFQDYV